MEVPLVLTAVLVVFAILLFHYIQVLIDGMRTLHRDLEEIADLLRGESDKDGRMT